MVAALAIGVCLPLFHRLLFGVAGASLDGSIAFMVWFAPIHAFAAWCAIVRPWFSLITGTALVGSIYCILFLLDGGLMDSTENLFWFAIFDWLLQSAFGILVLGIIFPVYRRINRNRKSPDNNVMHAEHSFGRV